MGDLLIAEADSAEMAVRAARRLRELGCTRMNAYTPYPVVELEEPLRLHRTIVPRIAWLGAVIGGAFAYFLQWWCNAKDSPENVGGRPLHSWPALIPITFETTVLFGSVVAFFAVLFLSRLPRLHDDIFTVDGFERTVTDKFWIVVDTIDPAYEKEWSSELALLGTDVRLVVR